MDVREAFDGGITQEKLKELFLYDRNTGLFHRKSSSGRARAGSISGSINGSGYVTIKINRKTYRAHRLAFLYMNGWIPDFVDHINQNRDDNRWENLRACDKHENVHNSKLYSNNKSGVKGVHWCKQTNKWHAQINVNKRIIRLGWFSELQDAKIVIEKARLKYHKEFANNG